MAWRDLAARVDQVATRTFDHGDILFQKMDATGAAVGEPVALPAPFDGAFKELTLNDGVQASTIQPVAWVHYADFPLPIRPVEADDLIDDRLIVPPGPSGGTYVIRSAEGNAEGTGAQLRLVRLSKA